MEGPASGAATGALPPRPQRGCHRHARIAQASLTKLTMILAAPDQRLTNVPSFGST